jgi:hypothetical protein
MASIRKPGGMLLWIGIGLLLVGVAPLVSAFVASWIAEANGCALHEGSTNACIIGGSDWGDALYTMFVMGWLMLLTVWLIPVGLVLAIVGLVQRLRGRYQNVEVEAE